MGAELPGGPGWELSVAWRGGVGEGEASRQGCSLLEIRALPLCQALLGAS